MATGAPSRVLIAKEDFIAREGLRCIVSTLPEVEIVGVAPGPEVLSSAVLGSSPDAVLFGLQPLPMKSEAVAAALQLRHDHPDLALIVLAYELGGRVPFDLLRQGSAGFGYLLRQNLAEGSQLLEAIRSVREGGLVLDPSVVNSVLETQRRRRHSRLHGLTDREHEVPYLDGYGSKQRWNCSLIVSL